MFIQTPVYPYGVDVGDGSGAGTTVDVGSSVRITVGNGTGA
jgi:hypothetical protein